MRLLPAPAVTVLAVVLLTAGCGGTSDPSPANGTTTPATASSTTAETTSDTTTNDCAAAQPEINAGAQVSGFVTGVEVESCDQATVTTSLGSTADDVQSALGICAIAANEAITHGVTSVSIESADGTALATGDATGNCTPA